VDEFHAEFEGRCSMVQYNPMKPVKRGLKEWRLSDGNFYIWHIGLYSGKDRSGGGGSAEADVPEDSEDDTDEDEQEVFLLLSVSLVSTEPVPGGAGKSASHSPRFYAASGQADHSAATCNPWRCGGNSAGTSSPAYAAARAGRWLGPW
jgi:hypothetical protein